MAKHPAAMFTPPVDEKDVVAVVKLAVPCIAKREPGDVVPMPMSPELVMRKCVAVVDPTTNSGTPLPRALGLTESCSHGVVVPIPTLPPVVAK